MSAGRYANVGQGVWTAPDGSQVPYLLRRLLPAPGTMATTSLYQVQLGDRIDSIAYSTLGDPTLSWKLGDANMADRPTQLAQPGNVLVIPSGTLGAPSGQ